MSIDEQITVMQAYKEGRIIECKPKYKKEDVWEVLQEPVWNWQDFNYRVKPEPKHRPYTEEEIMKAVTEALYYDYSWSPVEISQFRECVIERLRQ